MKLSLFSISYAGFWGQHRLALPEFIAKAAQLGYDGVMLAGKRPHVSPLDATQDYLASIQSALKENDIACSVIAGYTDLSPSAAAEGPVSRDCRSPTWRGSLGPRRLWAPRSFGSSPPTRWRGTILTPSGPAWCRRCRRCAIEPPRTE